MSFGKKKAPYKYRHIYVATPAYDGKVNCEYALSIAQAAQLATINGINVTVSVLGNGAFIDLARCKFAQMFLDENPDCTHLFFIDGDLEFDARAFVALAQSGKPVVAGAYPKRRQEEEEYPVRWKAHKNGGLWVEEGWVMCDRVATGFLCIERSVLEKMAKARPTIKSIDQPDMAQLFHTYINAEGRFMGEDFAWCDDYMEMFGEPIAVWPDFDFVHAGRKGNWNKFLEREIAKNQAEDAAKADAEKAAETSSAA